MLLLQLIANGFVTGCAYALVALGFAMVYSTIRVFHIAHGGIYTASAYVFWVCVARWHIPVVPSIGVVLVVSALAGMATDRFLYRPLVRKNAGELIQLLSSLGLYTVIVNVIAMAFGSQTQILRTTVQPTYSFHGLILSQTQVATVVTCLGASGAMILVLTRSDVGLRLRAMRDNPMLVALLGINPWLIRSAALALGSALSALGAVLVALDLGIDPHIGMPAVLTAAVAVIIGGVGIFKGAIVGGILIGVLQSIAVWQASARWQEMITYLLLILFLLFRPQGILGNRGRLEEAQT